MTPVNYHDRIVRAIFYPLAALSFIFIANDNPLNELVRMPSFVTDVIFALLVSFGVGAYIKWLTRTLDKKMPWKKDLAGRIKKQLLYGVIIPAVSAMFFEMIYLAWISISIEQSSIFSLELPLCLLLLLLINGYYLAAWLFQHSDKETVIVEKEVFISTEPSQKHIVVTQGFAERKIAVEDCAFIKSSDKLLWLYTFDNDRFRLIGTLDEWQEKLGDDFFRINRQYLAAASAINMVTNTETRKLKVEFCVNPGEATFVSKANAPAFRKWWKNDSPL